MYLCIKEQTIPPNFEITSYKGLDDDQVASLKQEIQSTLNDYYKPEADDCVLYNLHESLKDVLSSYNDSVKGRCYICLDQLCQQQDDSFLERRDLVRISVCFHRFHLICLHRDWFMKRHVEKDEFGGDIEYKASEIKRCPICRSQASTADVD
jgi:hypothetical protein